MKVAHYLTKGSKIYVNSPLCLGMDKRSTSTVYKLSVGVVSLSVFAGIFVLGKVRLGPISVHCTELRGVCFSEVENVLVL